MSYSNNDKQWKNIYITRLISIEQSGYTELSGIPPDLGEKQIFNLGESPRSGGIHFFQPLIWHGSFSDRKEYLLVKFCFGM